MKMYPLLKHHFIKTNQGVEVHTFLTLALDGSEYVYMCVHAYTLKITYMFIFLYKDSELSVWNLYVV